MLFRILENSCQLSSVRIKTKWDKCAFHVDPERLKGRVCYGGLDLSSTTDITAFVLVFPPVDEDDKFHN